jgi:hexosaminidase
MMFPRIAAMSEVLWSPKDSRNWEGFSRRIQLFMKRYDQMGLNYSKSAYHVTAKAEIDPVKKQLAVSLNSELAGVEIHYTTDGSEPNNLSSIYKGPIVFDGTTVIKAITFSNGSPSENVLTQSFKMNLATVKPVKYMIPFSAYYKGSGDFTLVNAIRGTTNHSDGEWQAWNGTDMEVVIDLQDTVKISRISVGSLQNVGAWVFFPKKVEFFISADGNNFQKMGEALNEADSLSGDKKLKEFAVTFKPVSANFVKVIARNFGVGPRGHAAEGKPVWLFVDEIEVE